jgi:hypothetical protein
MYILTEHYLLVRRIRFPQDHTSCFEVVSALYLPWQVLVPFEDSEGGLGLPYCSTLQLLLASISCLFCIVSWVIDRMNCNTCCCILNTYTHTHTHTHIQTQTTWSSLVVKDTSSDGWRRHAPDKELVRYKVFRLHWIRLRALYPYFLSFRLWVCRSFNDRCSGRLGRKDTFLCS